MSLSVIGAGLPRTGTMSLKFALEQLGFAPCCHMTDVIANRALWRLWKNAADGNPDWETIFSGYSASVDSPGCYFWRELAQHYPQTKLILTKRDPTAWFNSLQETLLSQRWQQGVSDPEYQATLASVLVPRLLGKIVSEEQRLELYRDPDFPDFLIARFESHNAEVIASIPPDRLLVFEVSEGWQPLCAFLDRPVPDTPFPRENSGKSFFDNVANLPPDERSSQSKDRTGRV
jgi:hypothetical protein